MTGSISAARVATLVGRLRPLARLRRPRGRACVLLIGDGRIGLGTRLPSERELTDALGVSRTTVTRAYAALRDAGYAEARRGAGTFTRVPGGRARAHDRALLPRAGDETAIDLNCAAASAPPGLAAAYAEAAADLPAYLGGHGYFPAGLPAAAARDRGDVRRPRAARPTPTRSWSPPAPSARRRSWRRRSPAPATGCWSSRRSTPTPPRRCGTAAPGSPAPRSTPTAGTSTRSAPRCGSPRRRSPT